MKDTLTLENLLLLGFTVEKENIQLSYTPNEDGRFEVSVEKSHLKGNYCGGTFTTLELAIEFFNKRLDNLNQYHSTAAKSTLSHLPTPPQA